MGGAGLTFLWAPFAANVTSRVASLAESPSVPGAHLEN